MQQRAACTITTACVDAFQRDGAVKVAGLLSSDELQLLEKGLNLNLEAPSPRAKIVSREGDPGRFFEDFCCWRDNPHYRQFVLDADNPLAAAAAMLTGSRRMRFYHDHVLIKEAGTSQQTPWHQDQPYYNIEGRMGISAWISIDSVARRSEALGFLAGSHRGPWYMPRSFLDQQAQWFPEGSLEEVPPIEADRANYPIIGWTVDPGDVIFFHMLTLHSAPAMTHSSHRRRVFSARYIGDDIVHKHRPWVTSPDFSELRQVIPEGEPLNHELFPEVWPPPT